MDWWTQLVNDIADTFYPERRVTREAEKKAEDEKAVAKAVKEGEVKLKKCVILKVYYNIIWFLLSTKRCVVFFC